MKHRHRLAQAQRHKPASRNKSFEVDEASDEQPHSSAGKAKKRTAHQMRAEGGKTKPRLDKFRRGGRPRNRYDNGGPAGSTAGSTRSADDPGGELATATRERKGTLGRYKTNCSARSRPTSTAADRSSDISTMAAWLMTTISPLTLQAAQVSVQASVMACRVSVMPSLR
jgi:hypothetical protein